MPKIMFDLKEFKEKVRSIVPFSAQISPTPILEFVVFTPTNDGYTLSSFNGIMGASVFLPAQNKDNNMFAVNAKKIEEVSSALEGNTVLLELNGSTLLLKTDTDTTSYKLQIHTQENCKGIPNPILSEDDLKNAAILNSNEFSDFLSKTIMFKPKNTDPLPPYLKGSLFSLQDNGQIHGVTTDGKRLLLTNITPDAAGDFPKGLNNIIVHEFLIIVKDKFVPNTTVALLVKDNLFYIKNNENLFYTGIIDGKFPSYQNVILEKTDKKVVLNVRDFKKSLEKVLVFQKFSAIPKVYVDIDNDKISLRSLSQESDEATTVLKAKQNTISEPLSFCLNGTQMLEFLKNIPSEKDLAMFFGEEHQPIRCELEGDESFLYLFTTLTKAGTWRSETFGKSLNLY